tara:strand:- start:357 stop:701 length:345 start_codon:yes stop_codon:yes gene_type:complete
MVKSFIQKLFKRLERGLDNSSAITSDWDAKVMARKLKTTEAKRLWEEKKKVETSVGLQQSDVTESTRVDEENTEKYLPEIESIDLTNHAEDILQTSNELFPDRMSEVNPSSPPE